ncbi:hypothetical protein JJC00_01970 [Bradyrhizobium diazoefficiens]|uniref:hypothetical protein n=1 Tax=Bradyrhizobium diazoefficiens TaxID=1355477 RepID=UPI00190E3543|nr:hypothetical protein [Bradyrhizobium diazoefficiens]QQO34496.1 hypothetical protein JJC00_01970 [Bradyrhizobium diazoefficiens]
MKRLILALILLATPVHASQITASNGIVYLTGKIDSGDERIFDARTANMPAGTIVKLGSNGGNLLSAMKIGTIVSNRGFDTWASTWAPCASACTLIWFSGRHAIVQRNTLLVFHMPYDSRTGVASPEGAVLMSAYLQSLGLTQTQADFLATTPSEGWPATEAAARRLGFRWQLIVNILGNGLHSCQQKICLTIP